MTYARWAPAVAWAGVIFWFSSIPGSSMPGRFSTLGHFGVFAILGALLMLALDRYDARAVLVATVLASLYAVSDEFHQSFVPMRTPDVLDWLVDTIGALSGAAAAVAVRRVRQGGPQ